MHSETGHGMQLKGTQAYIFKLLYLSVSQLDETDNEESKEEQKLGLF